MSKEFREMSEKQQRAKKPRRYSISVTGSTYDRLCDQVTFGSVASFVDEIVLMALDDSAISARLVAACHRQEGS